MFKNARLKLLLKLTGLERVGDNDDSHAPWQFPSQLSSTELQTTADMIAANRRDPRENWGEDNSIPAEDMLQRKYAPQAPAIDFGSDDDDDLEDLIAEAQALPRNTMTTRKPTSQPKKTRKRKSADDEDNAASLSDEDTIRDRRKARLLADIAKRRKIKSSEFVHDSDEEDDEARDTAFFSNEEAHRVGQATKIMEMLRAEQSQRTKSKDDSRSRKKQKFSEAEKENAPPADSSGGDDDVSTSSPKSRRFALASSDDEQDTPLSSQVEVAAKNTSSTALPFAEDSEDEDVTMEFGGAGPDSVIRKAVAVDVADEITGDDVSDLEIVPRSGHGPRRRTAILDDSEDE